MKILKDDEYKELFYNNLQYESRIKELEAYLDFKNREINNLYEEIKDLRQTNLDLQIQLVDERRNK